jgi:cell division septation protein DedD
MSYRSLLLIALALLAGCASEPPAPPPDEPAPVVISEGQPAPEPAPPLAQPFAPVPDRPSDSGKPQQTDTGRFRIGIASLDRAELTGAWVAKAEAAGYRTEVLAVEIDGKTWHRVLLPGYATLDEAKAALPYVQQDLGAPGAWVTSRRRAPAPDGAAPAADAPPPPPPEQPAN